MADPEFEPYVRAWQERARREKAARQRAVQEALAEACRIADMLVSEFGAGEVWLFGSLARAVKGSEAFHEHSDIDLAVDRIPGVRYFAAVSEALGVASRSVQIVELASCRPALASLIRKEGIRLRGSTGADVADPC
ncbi:MAG: nucleotidyltransferase domain-containing protein [Bacillota bacterium]